jgi:hypothetical protein
LERRVTTMLGFQQDRLAAKAEFRRIAKEVKGA